MTALSDAEAAPTPDPGLRDVLAEALHGDRPRPNEGRLFPEDPCYKLADRVLPVVEQQARERAAAELDAAAVAAEGMHDPVAPDCAEWGSWLRARAAAALRGQA